MRIWIRESANPGVAADPDLQHWIRNANPRIRKMRIPGFAATLDSRIQIRCESRDSHLCESLDSLRIWIRESRFDANPDSQIVTYYNMDSHGFAKMRILDSHFCESNVNPKRVFLDHFVKSTPIKKIEKSSWI